MNIPGDVEILKQVEDVRYGRDGTPERFIRVEFMVGKHGPFVERFPKVDGWDAQRDTTLTAFALKVRT